MEASGVVKCVVEVDVNNMGFQGVCGCVNGKVQEERIVSERLEFAYSFLERSASAFKQMLGESLLFGYISFEYDESEEIK